MRFLAPLPTRTLRALGLVLGLCCARAEAQNYAPEITNVGFVKRSYTLSVHGIAAVELDISGAVSSTPIAANDADMDGWGIEAATFGKRISWLIGYDERTIENDVNFVEGYVGAKVNMDARGNWAPYVVGTIRYSQDLEFPTLPPTTSDDFFGWSAGGGVAYHATDRFFLDVRVTYEGIIGEINARMGRDLGIQGFVATVGAGFTF